MIPPNNAIKQCIASQSIQFWLNLDWSVLLIGTRINFFLRRERYYRAEDMNCESVEERIRNFTWPYLSELTSSEWLIKNHLLIWHDQLIWSGLFVDQLIWLISSWSDQLIKIFLFSKRKSWKERLDQLICSGWSADKKIEILFLKKILQKKNIWINWSADKKSIF